MCVPQWPQPDNYDGNEQVSPHFSKTPNLTFIPRGHRFNRSEHTSKTAAIRSQIANIYRRHELQRCPRFGLYWAGPKQQIENAENDKLMLLVIELKEREISKWRQIGGEVRQLMKEWNLIDPHGVCIRYYKYNECADVRAESLASLPYQEASSLYLDNLSVDDLSLHTPSQDTPSRAVMLRPRPRPRNLRNSAHATRVRNLTGDSSTDASESETVLTANLSPHTQNELLPPPPRRGQPRDPVLEIARRSDRAARQFQRER